MYDPQGKDSPENRAKWERVQSFRRGWNDGSRRSLTREADFDHRPDLKEAYQRGYTAGMAAAIGAINAYTAEIGYDAANAVLR